jgi:DNA-binding GntR family transcriptional regulator
MSSIKPQPLGVVIADALRRDILNGSLQGGHELRQEELADKYGTSRIPVREAMQALERDGLIVVHANRRSVVAQFDEPEILDHYRVRALIEGEAAFECAERRVDVAALADIQAALERVPADSEQSEYERLNHRFHSWVWAGSGSRWLDRLAQSLWQGISPHTPGLVPGQDVHALGEHRDIVEALRSGDPERARESMRTHILRSCQSLLEYRQGYAGHDSQPPTDAR